MIAAGILPKLKTPETLIAEEAIGKPISASPTSPRWLASGVVNTASYSLSSSWAYGECRQCGADLDNEDNCSICNPRLNFLVDPSKVIKFTGEG